MQTLAVEQLDEAVHRLVTAVRPERIYLFGSYAAGTSTSSSDLDLLLVVQDQSDVSACYAAAERSLRGLLVPIELVICRHGEFARQQEMVSSLPRNAARTGKLLYAA